MTTLLLIGDAGKGIPIRALPKRYENYEVAAVTGPSSGDESGSLHSVSKSSDFVILCCNSKENRLAADEIWHLLRNKIVISLEAGTSIAELRDMFPLSKVSRCRLCVDAPAERTLSLFSHDSSFSDADLNSVKEFLGRMGEVLDVQEGVFEKLNREIDRSVVAIAGLISSLSSSLGVDRDIFEYALGWVLYGMGSAIAGGMDLREILPCVPVVSKSRTQAGSRRAVKAKTKRGSGASA